MSEAIIGEIYQRVRKDSDFRQVFLSNPREAVQEYNLPEELIRQLVLPNFSWVIEQKLAGVSQPGSEEAFAILKETGVTALITLTEKPLSAALLEKYGFQAEHSPIPDFTAPGIAQVEQLVATINRYLDDGQKVATHCAAGIGRTGTILACYLVSQGLSAQEAITTIRTKRPHSIETPEQEATVLAYEQHLSKQRQT